MKKNHDITKSRYNKHKSRLLCIFLNRNHVEIVRIHKTSTCCELHVLCFKALTAEAERSQRSCESN